MHQYGQSPLTATDEMERQIQQHVHNVIATCAKASTRGLTAKQLRERLTTIRDALRVQDEIRAAVHAFADGPDTDESRADLMHDLHVAWERFGTGDRDAK